MKKIFLIIIIYCIFAPVSNVIYATEQTTQEELIQSQIQDMNINSIIDKAEKDTKNNIDLNTIFEESLQGSLSQNIIINTVGKILGSELKESLKMLVSILLIIIIYGLMKNISENLGNNQTGKIGHFVQIIILITVLMEVYTHILQVVKETLETISSFTYMLLPLFISLSISTGNITAATGIQSVILVSINIITTFINQILIPIIIVATVIGIISNISDEVHMNRLSKYMKSTIIWILCIFLTIFTCILSLESNLGQGVDQFTSKTTKTAVSTFVPVVGKILGDTVESVLGCTNIIKNAVGTLGVIGTIFIAAVPLIRVGLTTLFIYLISGLAEIVADEKIVYVLEQMGDSCKVLLASITTVVIMLIIGFTITMKLGVPS